MKQLDFLTVQILHCCLRHNQHHHLPSKMEQMIIIILTFLFPLVCASADSSMFSLNSCNFLKSKFLGSKSSGISKVKELTSRFFFLSKYAQTSFNLQWRFPGGNFWTEPKQKKEEYFQPPHQNLECLLGALQSHCPQS